MQFDEANGLERGSSFLPKLLTPFPVWHRVHLGVLTPGSPHLKQNTFNTSDSHALNGCPTVPQFQHVSGCRSQLVSQCLANASTSSCSPGTLSSPTDSGQSSSILGRSLYPRSKSENGNSSRDLSASMVWIYTSMVSPGFCFRSRSSYSRSKLDR
ncbi:uncharacterized protein [Drosophila suzukii]